MRVLAAAFLLAVSTAPGGAQIINFDASPVGAIPADWTSAMTHKGGAPRWELIADATAPSKPNVLAQLSDDKTGDRFPLAIWEKASFANGEVSVKFKPVSGKEDRAGGLVWRYRDPDHYYLVRANAAEDNVVLYKVDAGRRSSIAPKGTPPKTYGVKHKVPSQTWSTLRVIFEGSHFQVFFNGARLFEVEDQTFAQPGKVGLWTKADSVTYFDDFQMIQK